MSFWAQVQVKITDMEAFKTACERNDVEFTQAGANERQRGMLVAAYLRDKTGVRGSQAFLSDSKGEIRLEMDTDPHWGAFAKRFGPNCGKLMRDYTTCVIEKNITRSGGMVISRNEAADGSMYVTALAM